VSEQIIWIKVPSSITQEELAELVRALRDAFKGLPYGFIISPDRYDVLSKKEVKAFLEALLERLG